MEAKVIRYIVARVTKEVDWKGMEASTAFATVDCNITNCETLVEVNSLTSQISKDNDEWFLFEFTNGGFKRIAKGC